MGEHSPVAASAVDRGAAATEVGVRGGDNGASQGLAYAGCLRGALYGEHERGQAQQAERERRDGMRS